MTNLVYYTKVIYMKYPSSLIKLLIRLQSVVGFMLSFTSHSKKKSKIFRSENKIHTECLEMSNEIKSELNDSNMLLTQMSIEKETLMCYKNIFSNIYKKTVV